MNTASRRSNFTKFDRLEAVFSPDNVMLPAAVRIHILPEGVNNLLTDVKANPLLNINGRYCKVGLRRQKLFSCVL